MIIVLFSLYKLTSSKFTFSALALILIVKIEIKEKNSLENLGLKSKYILLILNKKKRLLEVFRYKQYWKIGLATTYSHIRSRILPSALKCLTSVFGMGTGVSTLQTSPN